MLDLPNSFKRYLSSLRIFVSLSILKYGLQPRHLENLKKIYCAEAFYHKNSRQSVNIKKLSTNLLNTVTAFRYEFNFYCATEYNYYINKNLFTLLLLEISYESDFINISANENFLLIKCSSKGKQLLKTITALGGFSLFETKSNATLFIIPVFKTQQPSVYIESEWEYLFNKFSIINIFFDKYYN